MLLLVLVLVLIAFGLLVVELLTGSVLWAWISVAVAVAAAVALLVDWLQRRSAVRAGSEPQQAAPQVPHQAPPVYRGIADIEPVTEVLPVVSRTTPGGVTDGTGFAGDPGADSEATSVMPLVEPSSSAERPPGAADTITRSSGSSSHSVTDNGAGAGAAAARDASTEGTDEDGAAPAWDAAAEGRVEQETGVAGAPSGTASPEHEGDEAAPRYEEQGTGRAGGSAAVGPAGTPVGADSGADGTAGGTADGEGDTPTPDDAASQGDAASEIDGPTVAVRAATSSAAATAAAGATASQPDAAQAGQGAHERNGSSEASVTHDGPGAHERQAAAAPVSGDGSPSRTAPDHPADESRDADPTRAPDDRTAGHGASDPSGTQAGSDPDRTAGRSEPQESPAQAAFVGGGSGNGAAGQAPPAGNRPPAGMAPVGPHGEPPEEPRDAEIAALVAELGDEVVVVDEQPRYHLGGCRSLPGRSVIPLPVKEAVELGFTPCGWCAPDRTIAGRHQTAAR